MHRYEWGGGALTPAARRTQIITDAMGGSKEVIRSRVRYVPAKRPEGTAETGSNTYISMGRWQRVRNGTGGAVV